MSRIARYVALGLLGGGGGNPYTPPIANLLGWYDASDATTRYQDSALTTLAVADTDPVGGLKDKSGLGRHLLQTTAANRPQLKLAIQNGLAVLRFDGTNDQLFIDLTTIAQPFAVFAVAKSDAGATNYRSATGGSPTGNNVSMFLDSTTHGMSVYAGASVIGLSDDRGATHVFVGVFNQNSAQTVVRKDGIQTVTGNVSTGSANSFAIGASINVNFWPGDIMEVFWSSGVPSLAAIQSAEAYLKAKWGTP